MRIVFRADASVQIGTGHVMRCLTLAEELAQQGHECCFVCRAHPGHLGDLITSKGFELSLLHLDSTAVEPQPGAGIADNYAQWLGVTWQEDARQTLDFLSEQKPDWLVVDHYALDAQWEGAVASAVGKIMVIDDLANRLHECVVLLDQNVLDPTLAERYERLVSEGCALLLGPKYALLRPEYAQFAKYLPERDGVISRVLIFVGGSDPYYLTEKYLRALSAPEFDYLLVDVVIGKNYPAPAVIKSLVETRSRTRLYSGLPSLAALMFRADLMLGAGGATNWERMCLGLNSIVASIASNQDEINQTLERKGLIEFLGPAEKLTDEVVKLTVNRTLQNLTVNMKRSAATRNLVDGRGTEYVIQKLLEE